MIIDADYSTGKRTHKINEKRRPMYIENWSHEEIEQYGENPNLLFSKTNELCSRVILELLT